MIKLTQNTPTFGDCTAGYAVTLDHTYTVRELIQEIISNKKEEWGRIGIAPKKPQRDCYSIFGEPNCEYRYGKLLSNLPDELLDKKIHQVKAHGGWSNMDYLLYLHPEKAKRFNGKAIYNPNGKAGEYAAWACNFFTGCSHDCQYCYCKKGFMASNWSDKPQLKKCFKDKDHALEVFTRELRANMEALKASGLFFTFTSDPMLPETIDLTMEAVYITLAYGIPVQILTKRADFLDHPTIQKIKLLPKEIAWGFTLTGHDELEPGASSNVERIHAMKRLHGMGYKTFASIEPVVDFPSAFSMINLTRGICDLYKIGLMSGKRYTSTERSEAHFLLELLKEAPGRYYLKESLIKLLEIDRADLPADKFVGVDFNIFK